MEPAIRVARLCKTFSVPEREAGVGAALAALFHRKTREVTAVVDVSLEIATGEIVGFLGPNGAGKTTTLKVLSGLLHPTSGDVRVLGHVPAMRETAYLCEIALVMGNRNQLQWDIPVADSFLLHRTIYRIPWADFRRRRDELVALLELEDLLRKPVRNLSLGERMRAELAASLLHAPRVLFFDEPTLGLDVVMQKRMREFVAEYNRRHGATILLTSHYMADVSTLCRRVIVIHRGRICFDGDLETLSDEVAAYKEIWVTLGEPADLSMYGEIRSCDGVRIALRVPKASAPGVTARLLQNHPVLDLTVEDPPLEDVIEMAFRAGPSAPDVAPPSEDRVR